MVQPKSEIDLQFESTKLEHAFGLCECSSLMCLHVWDSSSDEWLLPET